MFIGARSVSHTSPGIEEAEHQLLRITVISVGVERIDGAAVGDALHLDGGVVGVESLCQEVTVGISPLSSC